MDSLVNLDKFWYRDGDLLKADICNTMQDVRPKHCPRGSGRLMMDEVVQSFENVKVTDNSLIWNTHGHGANIGSCRICWGCAATTMHSAEARKESRGTHAHENHLDEELG